MTDLEIGWLAGIVEGEGCIGFYNRNSVHLIVTMTDRDTIGRLASVTGSGSVSARRTPPACRPAWTWVVCHARDVARLLLVIYPLMGKRRQQKIGEAADRLLNVRYQRPAGGTVPHGTISGYRMHRRRNEETCRACRTAINEYNKRRR